MLLRSTYDRTLEFPPQTAMMNVFIGMVDRRKLKRGRWNILENVANLLTVTQSRLPHLRQTTAPSVNTTRSAGYYAFVRLNWSHPMISNLLIRMTPSRKTLMKAQEPRRGGYIILIFYFGTVTVMLIQQLEVTKLVRVRVI